MSYTPLKQAVTELETYMSDNPNVDDATRSRLGLLRDQLVNFIAISEEQTQPVEDENSWQDIVDVVEKEIVTSQADHPELTRKLDQLLLSMANAGL